MKKSEQYHLAQIAVVSSACIAPESKLEILETLRAAEDLEKFSEKIEGEVEAK